MDESLRTAFREDGAVLLKDCLDAEQLARCRKAFDWAVANPGPGATSLFDGTEQRSLVDNANPLAKEHVDELAASLPFGKLFAELWGSENVWFFAEEIFLKAGGRGARSSWHQDTAYLPWAGEHWANAWISFQHIPRKNSLEIVRGSHRGTQFDGTTFANPDDPTEPLHGHGVLPRLPDIDAELAEDPDAYDILSWAVDPGDVVVLHPRSLHGGAGVDADCPDRHTLVLRYFGDDATFRPLPEVNKHFARNGGLFVEEMAKLSAGDPFRSPVFRQVV
ncbi:phytanoyl-CoA dioxygenase family protein [Pseudonocardia sp. C8]|uniref:phytanoyl-CoA dioxygenase family protein n=1 Tax=Pseudonocardia sp. C8 TaxID=2762759 RepID=UPI0016432394|nr:phytanoyl-CoA dioxygenase family protein [Pseudonocardia sp. C8]MBC3192181.1 phytanoyl-CoA dioxygenase family protein [Pseudonocardia sp. C8]